MCTRQMQIREFDILSDSQELKPIDAICQFLYKGWLIRFSTAGRSYGACQIPVYLYTGVEYQDVFKECFCTVEEAIKYIDNL